MNLAINLDPSPRFVWTPAKQRVTPSLATRWEHVEKLGIKVFNQINKWLESLLGFWSLQNLFIQSTGIFGKQVFCWMVLNPKRRLPLVRFLFFINTSKGLDSFNGYLKPEMHIKHISLGGHWWNFGPLNGKESHTIPYYTLKSLNQLHSRKKNMEPSLGNLFLQILNLKGHLGARIPLLFTTFWGVFPSASGRLRTRALSWKLWMFFPWQKNWGNKK